MFFYCTTICSKIKTFIFSFNYFNIIFRIDSSIDELSKLDFSKYPVLDKKDYNVYCNRFKSFKTLYNHMLNGFEKDEMAQIFNENLTIYFESLGKALQVGSSRIDSDASFKQ